MNSQMFTLRQLILSNSATVPFKSREIQVERLLSETVKHQERQASTETAVSLCNLPLSGSETVCFHPNVAN